MEDAHHADLPAEICRVQGEALQGSSGGLQEQIVQAVLMRTGYRAQFLRQRKGHKKVRDRQEEHTLLFQPTRGRCILARGTMSVLTRRRAVCEFSALCALGEMPAKGLRTARCNGLHSGQIAGEHAVGACGAIGRAIASEDFRQFEHDRPPQAMRALPEGDGWSRWPWLPLWRSDG